ncbi:hypothetical protein CFP65_2642 [Kitasatospora sp. MMS16-BH015]|uniref:hypothetical protein n=1 Tax=Kitasatospora sp. MMS16-BH015 TaxID=2018025 RepID=UPI000CA2BD32|nr:hypothetical protein [Kitasatospora sp. MMS16-BH015]AUG77466.1 hypothetical protein CFP65_2642 [Kitasatospora sp. MMS16-BH015]
MTSRHIPPADRTGATRDTQSPALSLEFMAFRELHLPRYLSYARVWFREPGRAAEAVEHAFRALAAVWPEILVSSNPTAAAWQIVRGAVTEHTTRPAGPTDPGAVDEDLAILHYVVGLATPEIADVVGTDTASVASQLRHALRHDTEW